MRHEERTSLKGFSTVCADIGQIVGAKRGSRKSADKPVKMTQVQTRTEIHKHMFGTFGIEGKWSNLTGDIISNGDLEGVGRFVCRQFHIPAINLPVSGSDSWSTSHLQVFLNRNIMGRNILKEP
jgi:hypothetical protein